jgi:hypothetical protein
MKEYKLIKYDIKKDSGFLLTPCLYRSDSICQIRVASVSCKECKHHKGSTNKHVKCSYEYDMQEPSEIKTGKVTSSVLPKIGEMWRVRKDTKIQSNKSSWIFQNGQHKIYVSKSHKSNLINIKPPYGDVFKFEGGSTALKRWRGVAELILEAIDYLESEGI